MLGLGSLTASAGTILGAGAFTSVQANRSITIDVADDDRAFLRLEPLVDEGFNGDSTGRSGSYGQTVSFSIPGEGNGENENAEGVGVDSVYEFHDLLQIVNHGTNPVQLHSSYDGEALAEVALVKDSGILRADPPMLDVGESIDVGLYLDTHGSKAGEFNEKLTIVTDQPDG